MKFLKGLFERRALDRSFKDLFASGPTLAGIAVTPEAARAHPVVFGCLQVLSQDVARTPIKLQRREGDSLVDADDHDLYEILGSLPNPEQTAYQVKHTLMWSLLTHGRAYAEIVREDGRVVALWPLEAQAMRVDRDEQRRKRWTYQAGGGQAQVWTFDASQPPVLELVTESPLVRCKEIIGTAIALQVYVAKFFANGGRPSGVLKVPNILAPDQKKNLRESWQTIYGNPHNAHKVAVLDAGVEYAALGAPNDSAQLIETWHATSTAIAGAFRIPPWKLGDLSKATYSNVSAGEISYVSSTLDPYYQLFEEAIKRDLLTARQYRRFEVRFDRSALIRSDVQAQHQALATGLQNGLYSVNEARRTLGLNPVEGGDVRRINAALVAVEEVSLG